MMQILYDSGRCEEGQSNFGNVSEQSGEKASMQRKVWIAREETNVSLPRNCKYKNMIKIRPKPIRHPNTFESDHR